jgi:predicted TIM-barrel fold metal-dependent hydrolase
MIVDLNVLLGRWPFFSHRYEAVDGVLALMDRAGIDVAVLSSLNSVFYYDCEIGNHEVGRACAQHPDRLLPFAVLNPNLLDWRAHLHHCAEAYRIRGIKLHPDYHKYSLLGEGAAQVMDEARQLDLPVYVQTSLLDLRHHPGYCFVPETPIEEVARAVERYSENTLIVSGAKHFRTRARELVEGTTSTNFYVVSDGLGGPFDGLGDLVERLGADRLLFGSRTPLLYAEAARDVVQQSMIGAEEKRRILGSNATALLDL